MMQAGGCDHLGDLEHLLAKTNQTGAPVRLTLCRAWGLPTHVVVSFKSYGDAGVHSTEVILHESWPEEQCKHASVPPCRAGAERAGCQLGCHKGCSLHGRGAGKTSHPAQETRISQLPSHIPASHPGQAHAQAHRQGPRLRAQPLNQMTPGAPRLLRGVQRPECRQRPGLHRHHAGLPDESSCAPLPAGRACARISWSMAGVPSGICLASGPHACSGAPFNKELHHIAVRGQGVQHCDGRPTRTQPSFLGYEESCRFRFIVYTCLTSGLPAQHNVQHSIRKPPQEPPVHVTGS